MSGDAKSIGEELVASVRQLARDVSSLAEEARLAREGDSRQAEQIARARRASADENGDLMEAIDDVPGKILRAVRAGALASLQMPSPTEPVEAPPRTESTGDVEIEVDGKRFLFLSGTVARKVAWWVNRLLPWLIGLGGGGYGLHRHLAKEAPSMERRLGPRIEVPALEKPQP